MAEDKRATGASRARRFLSRLRAAIAPPPPKLSDEERRALERRLAAAFVGPDDLVAMESAQAPATDPGNPLAPVHDLQTAYAFVLASYPPHETPRERAVALAFAVVVEHVRSTGRDAATGRAPAPAALDRFLDECTPAALIAALRASSRSWVRRSVKRLRRDVGSEEHLAALFAEIVARYGGRRAQDSDGR